MSRFLPLRHWYPSMMKESGSIETRSFGTIFVGYEIKSRIEASKNKLKRVRK
jgi:hypothetical protein